MSAHHQLRRLPFSSKNPSVCCVCVQCSMCRFIPNILSLPSHVCMNGVRDGLDRRQCQHEMAMNEWNVLWVATDMIEDLNRLHCIHSLVVYIREPQRLQATPAATECARKCTYLDYGNARMRLGVWMRFSILQPCVRQTTTSMSTIPFKTVRTKWWCFT